MQNMNIRILSRIEIVECFLHHEDNTSAIGSSAICICGCNQLHRKIGLNLLSQLLQAVSLLCKDDVIFIILLRLVS